MDIESEEGIRSVVLRRSETSGSLGFSIMGGAGFDFPPVIYGIERDSPAAISGMLEAGDVILSINEREVVKLSTKEVLKCLRLSGDIIHIKFKRDPHVVSRVRHFLSTPHYLDGPQDNHHHHHSPSKQALSSPNKSSSIINIKKGSQIPIYSPNQAIPPTTTQYHSSPSRIPSSAATNPTSGSDQVDRINNKVNNSNISFSDEIFINHSFQHSHSIVQHSPSNKPNKVQAHIHHLQDKQLPHPFEPATGKNGRKNFETFVMTGDAILSKDLSKNESNPLYKASPTKIASKLTPMPHLPVFVEREIDYNRRVERETIAAAATTTANITTSTTTNSTTTAATTTTINNTANMDKSEASSASTTTTDSSPPLPPPPSSANCSYSSDKNNKSDAFLLPPPPEAEPDVRNGHAMNGAARAGPSRNHHNNVNANGNGIPAPVVNPVVPDPGECPGHAARNGKTKKTKYHHHRCRQEQRVEYQEHEEEEEENSGANNTEDTSISSSVMSSDSGDDDAFAEGACGGAGDERVSTSANKPLPSIASTSSSGGGGSGNHRQRLAQFGGRKSASVDSYEAATGGGGGCSSQEKERYAEYILLNGSRGTLNEDDYSSGRQSSAALIPPHNSYACAINKSHHNHHSSDDDSSISENDLIGAPYEGRGGGGGGGGGNTSSALTNDTSFSGGESDSSDVESMRVAPVNKAVDIPSAERLAKRIFALDGFKATDVWRHLSKNTDFNRVVAMEYLNFFSFTGQTLDVALRQFLSVCPLRGETQDRERVLSYFSGRYVECNPSTFGSTDSVHTLACAIMLLNTDMYTAGLGNQRMTQTEFIENLAGLNDGIDFPRDALKLLYLSIKEQPLVSPSDADDEDDSTKDILPPMIEPPVVVNPIEFKKGYLVRKSTHEYGGKKTPFGKRSWKLTFLRLKELLLIMTPDEREPKPGKDKDCSQIKLHHAFATVASDYHKRVDVLRLTLADRSQYLFKSSDPREMYSWIDIINWNAAAFSSPALEAPCSSSGRFERPLLPSCVSRASPREQAETHEDALLHWERELNALAERQDKPSKKKKKGSTSSSSSNSSSSNSLSSATLKKEEKEKVLFYQYEIRRYQAYLEILEKRANLENEERNGELLDQIVEYQVLPNPPILMEED